MPGVIAGLLPSLAWIFIGALFLTAGDIAMRSYFAKTLPYGFGISLFAYMLGILCMMMSFFGKHIAIASVAAVILNIVIYLLISHFFYGDTLSPMEISGIILGLVAVTVLELA